jgi:hypothetical protein
MHSYYYYFYYYYYYGYYYYGYLRNTARSKQAATTQLATQ